MGQAAQVQFLQLLADGRKCGAYRSALRIADPQQWRIVKVHGDPSRCRLYCTTTFLPASQREPSVR